MRNWSQSKLEKLTGIKRGKISEQENHKTPIQDDDAERYAVAFEITANELFKM